MTSKNIDSGSTSAAATFASADKIWIAQGDAILKRGLLSQLATWIATLGLNQDAAPLTDNTFNFGSHAKRWLTGWFTNIVITPAASVTPVNNGDMTFQLTNNTTLVIKVKGSDGTIRSNTLTLS